MGAGAECRVHHTPVPWCPFCAKAFERARKANPGQPAKAKGGHMDDTHNTVAIVKLVEEMESVARVVKNITSAAASAARLGELDRAMGILVGVNTLLTDNLALQQSAARLNAWRHKGPRA